MCVNEYSLEQAHTFIEKAMMELNPSKSPSEHKMYLAGVIDTLGDTGLIAEDVRAALYAQYVG